MKKKLLIKLILLAIVLVGNCLNSWSQSNTFTSSTGSAIIDTIRVPINYIRSANIKILQGKLYKELVIVQDSIIDLHKEKYNVLYNESIILQKKLNNSNNINDKLNTSLKRSKDTNKWLAGGALVSVVGIVVLLIAK